MHTNYTDTINLRSRSLKSMKMTILQPVKFNMTNEELRNAILTMDGTVCTVYLLSAIPSSGKICLKFDCLTENLRGEISNINKSRTNSTRTIDSRKNEFT